MTAIARKTYPAVVRKVADSIFWDQAGFYLCDDNNVWHIEPSSRSNHGDYQEFITKARAGQVRCKNIRES
jgi:hypothetical protein